MSVFTESWDTTENKVSPVAGGALCDPVDKSGSMGWPRRKDAMKSWSLFLLFLKKYQLTYGWVNKDSGAGAQDDTILNIIHTEHGYVQYIYIHTFLLHLTYVLFFTRLKLNIPRSEAAPCNTFDCEESCVDARWAGAISDMDLLDSLLTPMDAQVFFTPNKISKSF